MAITGKIGLSDKGDFANCYENFSCSFFSKIMNAYREWAAKAYRAVVKEVPAEAEKENLNDITMQSWWDDVSEKVRTGGLPYFSIAPMLYEWREKRGDIKKSGLLKRNFLKKAVDVGISELTEKYKTDQNVETKKELEDFNRMKSFSIVEAYYVNKVIVVAKQLMVYEMMKNDDNA